MATRRGNCENFHIIVTRIKNLKTTKITSAQKVKQKKKKIFSYNCGFHDKAKDALHHHSLESLPF